MLVRQLSYLGRAPYLGTSAVKSQLQLNVTKVPWLPLPVSSGPEADIGCGPPAPAPICGRSTSGSTASPRLTLAGTARLWTG